MGMFKQFLGATWGSRKNVCVVDRVMKVPETQIIVSAKNNN